MTRTALTKICLFAGLLAILIGACLGVDAFLATDPDEASALATPEETSDENADSILEAIGSDDPNMSVLAAACFDLALDTEIPVEFQAEALDPGDFDAAYASAEIMSFTYDGSPEDARASCTRSLEQKEWISLQADDQVITSFVKNSGTYRSLIVQYLSMDEKTVVLIDSTIH